jgi:predicted negative regulator of RcsB-dependent stress response
MAKEDIFEKEYVDERDKNNLEGLLEQLNLPPAAVKFVRDNKRMVQAGIAVLVIGVVAWALYGTYRDNQIKKSSEALFASQELSGQQMLDKLAQVEKDFGGTDAGLWAGIISAQDLMKNGKMSEAQQKFTEVRTNLKATSALWPLVTVGIAQAAEATGDFQRAGDEYGMLMELEGYKDIGFLGSARVLELQGDRDRALQLYEQYLVELGPAAALQKVMVEEKIARLKAEQ